MRAKQKQVTENGGEPTTLEALKEANQQLRLASDQLHAILDQGLFMARLELDGTLVHVNRSALEVPGYSEFLNVSLTADQFQRKPSNALKLLFSFRRDMR